MNLKNVICCGVPGAGGNDAVFAIYRGGDETRKCIETFWNEWRCTHNVKLCPMPLVGTPHGEPGLRLES
jgi:phosphomevalonate kinase